MLRIQASEALPEREEDREFGINLRSGRQPSTLAHGVGERDFPLGCLEKLNMLPMRVLPDKQMT